MNIKENVIKAIIRDINKAMPAVVNNQQQEEINKSYYDAIKSNLDYFDINDKVPTEIEKQIQGEDRKIYTPKIWYNYIDRLWKCEYTELKNMNDLLCHIEGENIEELIGKVWEYIESKEYGEIYDLTYNFKEYEI